MVKILSIQASPRGERSVSRTLTAGLLNRLAARLPELEIVDRDLSIHHAPPITDDFVTSMFVEPSKRDSVLHAAIRASDELILEVEHNDAIVIGSPMYNFSVSTALKGWIDHIVRFNRTFAYAHGRSQGLLKDRPVTVITSSGGVVCIRKALASLRISILPI